jgi:23S rRNA (guanosine2251-2'-O)-methyltransferase
MDAMLEGRNPVLEALKSGRPMNRIYISKDIERHSSIAEILHLSKERRIPIEWVSADVIKAKSHTKTAQGVLASTSAKDYVDVEDLLQEVKAKALVPFFVMLDGLKDPHNLGAILRTADAAGCNGVIIPERRAVGLTETVTKVSAGAVEYVPVARVINLNHTIKILKEEGIWVVGIDAGGKRDIYAFDFKMPVCLVVGAEGEGLSRLVGENCDEILSIPMVGKISSLNASVAAGITMYEVMRQRGLAPQS